MSFLHAGVIERLLVRLFASSSKFFLDWLSAKLFNDAVDMGLVDTLAGTIDVAVRALNGADPTAALFESPNITADNVASVLNSPNMTTAAAALIFNSAKLSTTRAGQILNSPNISVSKVKSILAESDIPASRVQDILYAMADQGFFDRLVNLFTFDRPDATYSTSTTLTTGVNFLRNVGVASGVTLTLGASPCVLVADTLTNSGTITTNVVKGAGGTPGASGAGAGGAGRHGIIILTRSISTGTITADGGNGAAGTTVAASAAGGAGGAGLFWEITGFPAGTGGDGGGGGAGAGKKNGGGGGGGYGYAHPAGGSGGTATVVTYPSGMSLIADVFKAVIDFWLVNVVGKTPTTTRSIPALGGSGGGAGTADDGYSAGGGGGGGGGQIIIYGTSITAGSVSANGGDGGRGGTEGSYDSGGGGGGGGIIYVFYKSLSGTFTFSVAGGTGGLGATGGYGQAYQTGKPGTSGSAVTFAV